MKQIFYVIILPLFFLSCGNTQLQDPIPEYDGFTIESNQVNETRVITIWTPPAYKTGKDSYPVLYMPDGGIKEDFPHIANTLAKLIEEKSIPPFILVGIENTERYRDLSGESQVKEDEKYCPLTDGATYFRNFVTKELFQKINKNYRTTPKKAIIGESLAGLFVVETLMKEPASFDIYIAMDPSLWWNDHYLVKNAESSLQNLPNKETKLWFAGSGVEDISQFTNQLSSVLENNAPEQLKWKYSDEPNEQHSTIFRATKEKALIWALND